MAQPENSSTSSDFQRHAIEQITAVLTTYLTNVPPFDLVDGGKSKNSYFVTSFDFEGQHWELEIYRDVAYVECARGRWDSDIFGRNPPYGIERVRDFVHRLDRLLSGGEWFTPEDKGLPDLIKEKVKALFRR